MTSDCFVYVMLPGTTEMVTAGRYELAKDRLGSALGKFVYGKTYLGRKDRVEFDPKELKLGEKRYQTLKFGGNFGALRDAAPDAWGRRVIEKAVASAGLTEMEYLLNSPDDRAGALGFGRNAIPPAPLMNFNRTVDLTKVMDLADEILTVDEKAAVANADPDRAQVEQLLNYGTSMGGARAKATVEDDNQIWLAKFSQPADRWNNPKVEHAVMQLAKECGIHCAETKIVQIGGKDVLLVKRFDREKSENGFLRKRMISALTLLGADEKRDELWSYILLAEEIKRFTAGNIRSQLAELFRRICFNCLVSNLDDHPRNHAFIADKKGWELSPAYDLTPTPSFTAIAQRDLALSFGKFGRYANQSNLLSECGRFGLNEEEAARIIFEMKQKVSGAWYAIARAAGVSEVDCRMIESAFVYEGFSYDLTS